MITRSFALLERTTRSSVFSLNLHNAAWHPLETLLPWRGMPIPLTFATLALMTAAMIVLGVFWLRVPPGLRFFLPRAAIVLVLLHGFFVITRWGTTSERLNALINWLAVAGYEL